VKLRQHEEQVTHPSWQIVVVPQVMEFQFVEETIQFGSQVRMSRKQLSCFFQGKNVEEEALLKIVYSYSVEFVSALQIFGAAFQCYSEI
jgi:hypothetical protein